MKTIPFRRPPSERLVFLAVDKETGEVRPATRASERAIEEAVAAKREVHARGVRRHLLLALVIGGASYVGSALAARPEPARATAAPRREIATSRAPTRRPAPRTEPAVRFNRLTDPLPPAPAARPERVEVARVRFREVRPGVVRGESYREWVDRPATSSPFSVTTSAQVALSPTGPVDLNRASTADLDRLPGVGPVTAAKIVAARPFRSVGDLRKIPGIGEKRFATLAPLVVVR